MIKETDWKKDKETNNITLNSKPMNGISVNAYKVVQNDTVAKSPKAMADKMMSFTEADWQAFDPSIKFRKVLSQTPYVFHQQNGMPWPLSARDFVLEQARFTDVDGSEYVLMVDTTNAAAPEVKGVVRGRVLIGCFIFLADGAGTKCVRLVQVDPAGSIPTSVYVFCARRTNSCSVNSKASDFITDVVKMKAL
jgi:hypothetical protein